MKDISFHFIFNPDSNPDPDPDWLIQNRKGKKFTFFPHQTRTAIQGAESASAPSSSPIIWTNYRFILSFSTTILTRGFLSGSRIRIRYKRIRIQHFQKVWIKSRSTGTVLNKTVNSCVGHRQRKGRLEHSYGTGNETKISRYRVVIFKDRNIAGYFSSLSVESYFTGTVLWIRTETNGSALKPMDPHWNQWIRTEIRIFCPNPNPRIQGSYDRKLGKIYSCQKNLNLIKSCNLPYVSLGLHKGRPNKLQENSSSLNKTTYCTKTWNFFTFVGHLDLFSLLDPDPADQNEYGSGTLHRKVLFLPCMRRTAWRAVGEDPHCTATHP